MTSPEQPAFRARVVDGGDGACVVELVGDLDMSTAAELDRALETAVDLGRDVVIDCTALTFIDSSGLNALVRAHHRLDGRELRLRSVSDQLRRVLKVTRLNELFAEE